MLSALRVFCAKIYKCSVLFWWFFPFLDVMWRAVPMTSAKPNLHGISSAILLGGKEPPVKPNFSLVIQEVETPFWEWAKGRDCPFVLPDYPKQGLGSKRQYHYRLHQHGESQWCWWCRGGGSAKRKHCFGSWDRSDPDGCPDLKLDLGQTFGSKILKKDRIYCDSICFCLLMSS